MPVTRALLVPMIRALSWWPLGVAAALALVGALAVDDRSPAAAFVMLRIAALLLGTGGAVAMVDRMGALVVPVPRWLRQWLRLVLMATPAALAWATLGWLLDADLSAGLVAEAVVCAMVGFAGAAVAARHRHTPSAAVAGPVTQFGLLAVSLVPRGSWSPWPPPGDPHWDPAHRGWWTAAAVVGVALVLANRDGWPLLSRRRPT